MKINLDLWIARDKDGTLWMYWGSKPILNLLKDGYQNNGRCMLIQFMIENEEDFKDVTFEGGPVKYQFLLEKIENDNGSHSKKHISR